MQSRFTPSKGKTNAAAIARAIGMAMVTVAAAMLAAAAMVISVLRMVSSNASTMPRSERKPPAHYSTFLTALSPPDPAQDLL